MEHTEIKAVVFVGIFLFAFLTMLMVFMLLFYQKKRFQHYRNMLMLEKKYNEELLHSRLEIQEETLNNISQEIHDNVAQMLSLVKVELAIVSKEDLLNRKVLASASNNLSRAFQTLRSLAKGLSTDRIQLLDIVDAVSGELDRISSSGILETEISILGQRKPIAEGRKLILFRVIQESFQNVIKHSNATTLKVRFDFSDFFLGIQIEDNGIGFSKQSDSHVKGMGINSLENRVKLLKGSINIESILNQGTKIKIEIAYE